MKKPSSAPEHSDSETIISAQADLRLRELETRVIRDDVERPPYYEYCIAKVPLTFQAVAQRAVCLAEGDEEWEEGIEEEMVPFGFIEDGHDPDEHSIPGDDNVWQPAGQKWQREYY